MPGMSKKLKKEFAFFLNDWGRRNYNGLCPMDCEFMIASTPLPPGNLSESLFHLVS